MSYTSLLPDTYQSDIIMQNFQKFSPLLISINLIGLFWTKLLGKKAHLPIKGLFIKIPLRYPIIIQKFQKKLSNIDLKIHTAQLRCFGLKYGINQPFTLKKRF